MDGSPSETPRVRIEWHPEPRTRPWPAPGCGPKRPPRGPGGPVEPVTTPVLEGPALSGDVLVQAIRRSEDLALAYREMASRFRPAAPPPRSA
ncbi:hypothetical protein GCM10010260_05660 [Streptomyces filipinensis]|uniref:Uncharacterized protein n=1 Tax=Streptomyces filipinensis TaxID=66887 RepID=A0A918M8W3_9ACTN|nr:hypothetical protein GCM10010260_05660 [Streptomyces filipinensis]